jgi:hypothetical protein
MSHTGGAFTIVDTIDVFGKCLSCGVMVTGKLGIRASHVDRRPALQLAACQATQVHPLAEIELNQLAGVQAINISMERPKSDPSERN